MPSTESHGNFRLAQGVHSRFGIVTFVCLEEVVSFPRLATNWLNMNCPSFIRTRPESKSESKLSLFGSGNPHSNPTHSDYTELRVIARCIPSSAFGLGVQLAFHIGFALCSCVMWETPRRTFGIAGVIIKQKQKLKMKKSGINSGMVLFAGPESYEP